MKQKIIKASVLTLIFCFVLSSVSFAQTNVQSKEKDQQQEAVIKLLKKYQGRAKFIDNNNSDFKRLDTAKISNITDLEKRLDEVDAIFNAIITSEGVRGSQSSSNGISIQSVGTRTISTWYPVGIGAYEFAWLNTAISYTYLWGKPPGYPNDSNHNYFSSGNSVDLWISGIGSIVANAKLVGSPNFIIQGNVEDPNDPTKRWHNIQLVASYTFKLTYGLPTPWGTIGVESGPKTNTEYTDYP